MDRLRRRPTFAASQQAQRARRLLARRYGEAGALTAVGVACGATGLLAEHTHLAPGYALLQHLPYGTAVALRPGHRAETRIVFEEEPESAPSPLVGAPDDWTLSPSGPPLADHAPRWIRVVEAVLRAQKAGPLDVAVVTTVPAMFRSAYWAALATALARAFASAQHPVPSLDTLQRCLETVLDRPFSAAYLHALTEPSRPAPQASTEAASLVLVDTFSHEHVQVPPPPTETLAWGAVEVPPAPVAAGALRADVEHLDKALAHLQTTDFPRLRSLHALDHQNQQHALTLLPERLRPITRYVMGENRRVPRLVAALRRQDVQMLGALLFMAHHAARTDAQRTSHTADALVEHARGLTVEGLFGAVQVDPSGALLVAGQPYELPRVLDQLEQAAPADASVAPFLL